MKERTIFLDIDGVLADFVTSALALFDRLDLLEPGRWPKGEYSLEKLLGISTSSLWNFIDHEGAGFWSNLKPDRFYNDLYIEANRRGDVYLLSTPSLSPFSHSGKRLWIQRMFGPRFRDYILTGHKELLAAPGRILIDDSSTNCAAFIKSGGQSITYPRPWNHSVPLVENCPHQTVIAELDILCNTATRE